jgi:citrate synthase
VQACNYSSSSEPDLKETFKRILPAKRELLKKVKAHADKTLGEVKVENTLGGMRCASSIFSTLHN